MNVKDFKAIIEGLLFASGDEGVTVLQMAKVLEIDQQEIKQLLKELKEDYESQNRGMIIMQSHDIYHLTTRPEHSSYYQKLIETPHSNKLSQAALETLAIIAYKQPITRVEISNIRGVNSDRPIQTLLSRMLIEEVGRKDTIGRPILFGTSKDFLTYFGLTSLDELPPLPEDIQEEDVEEEATLLFQKYYEEDPLQHKKGKEEGTVDQSL